MTDGMIFTPDDGSEANSKSIVVFAFVVYSEGTKRQPKMFSMSIANYILIFA